MQIKVVTGFPRQQPERPHSNLNINIAEMRSHKKFANKLIVFNKVI